MLPATAVVPKELLPVGTWPMLHWTLREVVDAGIEGVAIVVSPNQSLVGEYVAAAVAAGRGSDTGPLAALGRALAGVEVVWVEQPRPGGVGDAFNRCAPVTGEDGFGVLLPDNWFDARIPPIAQVASTLAVTGLSTIGLTAVTRREADLFGNVGGVELEELGGNRHRIVALQDKLSGAFQVAAGETVLRGCARYALNPDFYRALRVTGPLAEGEWDDVPAFQHLIAGPGLAGHRIEGVHYDVGHPRGYAAASRYLAERGGSLSDSASSAGAIDCA